jgi:hypothetical protein
MPLFKFKVHFGEEEEEEEKGKEEFGSILSKHDVKEETKL